MESRSAQRGGTVDNLRRFTTETKESFKTSEFWLTIAVIVGILASALLIKGNDGIAATDEFLARQAWLYVAIVASAYTIGRGLAKSGQQEPYGVSRGGDVRDNTGQ